MNKLYLLTFNGLLTNFEYEARIYLLGVFDSSDLAEIEIEESIKRLNKNNISEENLRSLFKITEIDLNYTLEIKDNIDMNFDNWSNVVTEEYLGGATI